MNLIQEYEKQKKKVIANITQQDDSDIILPPVMVGQKAIDNQDKIVIEGTKIGKVRRIG